MPHTSQPWPLKPSASNIPTSTTRLYQLVQALTAGHITQAEFDQHMDFYLGLNMLDGKTPPRVPQSHTPEMGGQTDNLITRRLWAGLWLPLGYILCKDEQWRHISTIAQYGKRNPRGKDIMLAITNQLTNTTAEKEIKT